MFWASDNLFRLFSHLNMHHVGLASLLMDNSNPAMVTSVGHSFVNGGFDQDGDLLPGLIDPQDSA
jgi:hypothetical protein